MYRNETKSSVKVVGTNGQISLGKEYAGKQVLIEEYEPGVWKVRTALVIPENEMWLHQPQVKEGLQRAVAYAQKKPVQETHDIDAFFEALKNDNEQSGAGFEQSSVSRKLAKTR